MQRINVRVNEQLKDQLEVEAREQGVRPAEVVRRILEEHMRRRSLRPNARQLAEQLGILGSAPGLPADLSTNPRYLEGFGE